MTKKEIRPGQNSSGKGYSLREEKFFFSLVFLLLINNERETNGACPEVVAM